MLDWGAGGGQGLVRVSLGGGGLTGSGGFVSGDDDRVVSGVYACSIGFQPLGDLLLAEADRLTA